MTGNEKEKGIIRNKGPEGEHGQCPETLGNQERF